MIMGDPVFPGSKEDDTAGRPVDIANIENMIVRHLVSECHIGGAFPFGRLADTNAACPHIADFVSNDIYKSTAALEFYSVIAVMPDDAILDRNSFRSFSINHSGNLNRRLHIRISLRRKGPIGIEEGQAE